MRLALRSWRLRRAARDAVGRGACDEAFRLAAAAEELQSTSRGKSLLVLSAWLSSLE